MDENRAADAALQRTHIGYLGYAGLVVVLLLLGAILWQIKICVAGRAVRTPKATSRR